MGFETAIFQWDEGVRRLRGAPPDQRAALERVTTRIVSELRRRLGGAFSSDELADYYEVNGTDWCLGIAMDVAPGHSYAWDSQVVADAAFATYVREATDYAGGRRLDREQPMD